MTLGQKITVLRKERGMTQEELSEAIGVTRQTISKWELDASTPDLGYLCRLCDLFSVTADEFIRPEITLDGQAPAPGNSPPTETTAPADTEPNPAVQAITLRKPLNTRPAGWVMLGLAGILLLVALFSLLTENETPELLIFSAIATVFALELLLVRWHPLFVAMWTAWVFWSLSVTVVSGSPFVLLAMTHAGGISIALIVSVLWVFYTAFCIGATVGLLIRRYLKNKPH